MAADWTAFAMATALKNQVAARTGITSLTPEVRVVTYLPSPDEQFSDVILIGFAVADSEEHQRAHAGGDRFDEVVELQSKIQVIRPGAGQDVADTARARAQALLAEVDEEVRDNLPTVGDQSNAGKVVERVAATVASTREGVGAMHCIIDFVVQYWARTS